MAHYILYPPVIIDAGPNAGVYLGGPPILNMTSTCPRCLEPILNPITHKCMETPMDNNEMHPAQQERESIERLTEVLNKHVGPHQRRLKRLVRVLHARGWYTRADVTDALDSRADFTAVQGIGPVLAKTLAALLQECADEECWAEQTGMSNNGQGRSLLAPPQEA